MNRNLSFSARVHNANGCVQAEQLHALHQWYIASSRAREEYTTLWSMDDQCSWGFNWGRLRGWTEVWWASVARIGISTVEGNSEIVLAYPEAGGRDPRMLDFYELNELNSGVVEAADDGQTVRASWVCHGYAPMLLRPNRAPSCSFSVERYGADFIWEDGEWKYLHEQVAADLHYPMDQKNWGRGHYLMALAAAGQLDEKELQNTDALDMAVMEGVFSPPPRSDETELHQEYSSVTPVQDTVRYPVPYRTLDDENSYAPYMRPEDFKKHDDWLLLNEGKL